jgi:outer membrane lipoprotein-sorting protein
MNPMKLAIKAFSGAAVSAALVVSAPALPQDHASADLAGAVAALRAISTLRADFVQTGRNGQKLPGVMTLKRPGRIRFQYGKGIPFLIVADGKALTFIDYEVRQVQRWPIGNSPLGALFDPKRDVMKFGRVVPGSNLNVVSVEVRDKGHPEYGVITLVFLRKPGAPGGLELASWAALDSQNQRTVVTLSNQQYGLAVADNTFRFNDPRPTTRR